MTCLHNFVAMLVVAAYRRSQHQRRLWLLFLSVVAPHPEDKRRWLN